MTPALENGLSVAISACTALSCWEQDERASTQLVIAKSIQVRGFGPLLYLQVHCLIALLSPLLLNCTTEFSAIEWVAHALRAQVHSLA
jgi:hypothetical protein